MMGWLMLIGAVLFNTLGNLFIKQLSETKELHGIMNYIAPPFILGLGCFGANLVLYSRALKYIPIAVAYPILVGSTMSCIVLVAVSWFGEAFGVAHALGMTLVLSGIWILAHST
jgi:multidrug transporter EmrE-like cation transporter